jgi:hypothetical protein
MEKGVYTAICSNCGRALYIHVLDGGEINTHFCKHCKTEFDSVEQGEVPNRLKTIGNEPVIEEEEVEVKKPKKAKKSKKEKDEDFLSE